MYRRINTVDEFVLVLSKTANTVTVLEDGEESTYSKWYFDQEFIHVGCDNAPF